MWIAIFTIVLALAISSALGALVLGSYEEKPLPQRRLR